MTDWIDRIIAVATNPDWPTIAKNIILPSVGALIALIGVSLKDATENRRFFPLTTPRKHVPRKWTGTFWEGPKVIGTTSFTFDRSWPLSLRFWFNRKLLVGRFTVNYPSDDSDADALKGPETFAFRGGFYLANKLMFDYKVSAGKSDQIGTMMLSLETNDKAARLSGSFLGYLDAEIFSGTVRLDSKL